MKSLITIRKFQSALSWTLLLLTFAECQFIGAVSMAAPTFTSGGHQTDRRGANSIPYLPVGDYVQLYVTLDSSDPIDSPTISVEASQNGTTLTLDPIPPGSPLFEGLHLYFTFTVFDPELTGSWLITATDSTGQALALTPPITEPEFLPLVEGITLQGTPLGAMVSWTVPDLTGFDVDGVNVRLITASGSQRWQSELLAPQTTSFTAPAGDLQVGVDYVYMISLVDVEGGYVENLSSAFSTPFFYTVPGDYSGDGTVGPEDYDLWKSNFGSADFPHADGNRNGIVDAADYTVWRDHMGEKLSAGVGSGAALPSAAPLSPAIPEPGAIFLATMALVGLGLQAQRTCRMKSPSPPSPSQTAALLALTCSLPVARQAHSG